MNYRKPGVMALKNAASFNTIECMPLDEVRRIQEDLLRRQMGYLKENSTLYKKKLAAAGVDFDDVQTIADLSKVPFTVKQDLRDSLASAPPYGEHMTAPLSEIVQMQASSGTTGSPAYVAMTELDVEIWQDGTARDLFACGIRPGDRVLHGFSMSKGFVGGIPMFQAVQYMGAIDIPVGADGGVDRLLIAARDMRPRAILGTPNFLLHLAEMAPKLIGMDAKDLGVEVLVVGGEPGGGIPAIRQAIQDAWGAECRELMGGTDLGVSYWGECAAQQGMHMNSPDYVLAELIDPETGQVVPFETGQTGELVYTALQRQASPVLRFRSGDHVIVTGTECSCGRTGPMIRCFGRTDDMLIVRGVNVFPSAIQDIIASMPETNGVMRVWADFEGHTTQANLKVLVERAADADPANDARLADLVGGRLRNALSFKPDITIVPADSFEKPGVQKVKLTIREAPAFLKD